MELMRQKLWNGDCLELMNNIEDKSIDLIIADLPYGVTAHKDDKIIPFDKLWVQYNRIIKNSGSILLFGQGLFLVDLINSNRKQYRYDLVWDKVLTSGFLDANRKPLRVHEQIAMFQKYPRKTTYNPQFTQGKPLHGRGTSYMQKSPKNQNYGQFNNVEDNRKGSTQKYPKSILSFSKVHQSKTLHRTEKAIPLLEYLIKTYSNENDIVLDNCMGSGTCGVACKNTNRNFIGIELDNEIFNIAKNRIL